MYKIAVITPLHKEDYLANTVLDGLDELESERKVSVLVSPSRYPSLFFQEQRSKSHREFISFAQGADAIFFLWGKDNTDWELADKIKRWDRTVFIDGSEVGNNGRYDTSIQWELLNGIYKKMGAINEKMVEKCVLYFRREKPYLHGIIPLPFGIERGYRKYCLENASKDIDFFCVFGQDEYPPLRYYVRELLVQFCKKNGFSYFTEKTADRNAFYKSLARSKVGVSVGGGGYDTARFWETLGNNCMLLTEHIDIYPSPDQNLPYARIFQFNNLFDFAYQLNHVSTLLSHFNAERMRSEYDEIINAHSSKARVEFMIRCLIEKGLFP